MIKLIVKKQSDSSVYFEGFFLSNEVAQKWVSDEQEKLYFVQSGPFDYEYIDVTPEPIAVPSEQELASKLQKRKSAFNKIFSAASLTKAEKDELSELFGIINE